MQIIYPDVLFIVNFCMDYIALYLCGIFVHAVKRKRLLFLSSLLGGAYSVISVFVGVETVLSVFINFSVSVLLCYITYGKNIKGIRFFRLMITFYTISLTLGGAITAFYNFLNRIFSDNTIAQALYSESKKAYMFLLISVLCSFLIVLFAKLFLINSTETVCSLKITVLGNSKSVSGIVDSGNYLREPFSGKPVIIVKKEAVFDILPCNICEICESCCAETISSASSDFLNIRIIPIHTVAGDKIILGYNPEKIEISLVKKGRNIQFCADAVIGLDTDKTQRFEGCDAIVPSTLII